MTSVEKSVMENGGVILCITKVLDPSNMEPKDEFDQEILTVGRNYTVVDSHMGLITGRVTEKRDHNTYDIIGRFESSTTEGSRQMVLNYHDLLFVMETEQK